MTHKVTVTKNPASPTGWMCWSATCAVCGVIVEEAWDFTAKEAAAMHRFDNDYDYCALMTALATEVMLHAEANYEKGWDEIVECYTTREIVEVIYGCKTPRGAINAVAKVKNLRNERRADIMATAW